MIGQFEILLDDLGKELELKLKPDHKNACSIQIHAHIIIQMQPDDTGENLWLFCKIAETPPGKFRENILKEALKINAKNDPRPGILCYISAINYLSLYQKYPIHVLTGDRLAGLLGAFLVMAESWRDALLSGQSAPLKDQQEKPSNPFGMI